MQQKVKLVPIFKRCRSEAKLNLDKVIYEASFMGSDHVWLREYRETDAVTIDGVRQTAV